jgi:hypothetical protein
LPVEFSHPHSGSIGNRARFTFASYSPILESVSIGFTESENRPAHPDRYVSTIAIAAAIIVAVRLAKVADLDMNITTVITTVQQSVRLARTILDEAMRH